MHQRHLPHFIGHSAARERIVALEVRRLELRQALERARTVSSARPARIAEGP